MLMYKKFILVLLASLGAMVAVAVSAQATEPNVTLDQAVRRVQADTDGKVLSAEPRRIGRHAEYRIKVLTPTGHVRVIVVSSEPGKGPAAAQSTRRSPGGHAGGKE